MCLAVLRRENSQPESGNNLLGLLQKMQYICSYLFSFNPISVVYLGAFSISAPERA